MGKLGLIVTEENSFVEINITIKLDQNWVLENIFS